MYFEQIIEILKGLLTPLIAIVATYIAWQQWQTNRKKLELDLYERRLRIYEEVQKILRVIARDRKASFRDLLDFQASVSEMDFLFGREIREYIDEIYTHGCNLGRWNDEYRDNTQEHPEGYDHNKVVAGTHKEFNWLVAQFEPAKEKFQKYLRLSK